MRDYKNRFFELALSKGNLSFGRFTLKSGRVSPYFFNAGGFDDGASLAALGHCYADAIVDSGIDFDMLFGPAYKGIPLAAATAIALHAGHGLNKPFAFNRKEAKDHGEGGLIVGAPLQGRVMIIDDVISAGTSVRESIEIIHTAGAQAAAVVIALDRQERGSGALSAAQEVQESYAIPCRSIAGLDDLINYLESQAENAPDATIDATIDSKIDIGAIRRYRDHYGA